MTDPLLKKIEKNEATNNNQMTSETVDGYDVVQPAPVDSADIKEAAEVYNVEDVRAQLNKLRDSYANTIEAAKSAQTESSQSYLYAEAKTINTKIEAVEQQLAQYENPGTVSEQAVSVKPSGSEKIVSSSDQAARLTKFKKEHDHFQKLAGDVLVLIQALADSDNSDKDKQEQISQNLYQANKALDEFGKQTDDPTIKNRVVDILNDEMAAFIGGNK